MSGSLTVTLTLQGNWAVTSLGRLVLIPHCRSARPRSLPASGCVIFFQGTHRLGTILGRFSIIYFRGLGLRIRGWVRVWVRVWVRIGVWVRVSVVLWSW